MLGALFEFVRNQGDCWQVIVEALDRHLEDALMRRRPRTATAQEAPVYQHPLESAGEARPADCRDAPGPRHRHARPRLRARAGTATAT